MIKEKEWDHERGDKSRVKRSLQLKKNYVGADRKYDLFLRNCRICIAD